MSELDKNFKIEQDANWIASIPISNGELKAFRVPGVPDPARTPLLAELAVDYDDEIRIKVTARKGWPVRWMSLQPHSEIAIINTSRGLAPRSLPADHFQIYGELSSQQVELRAPDKDYSHRPVSLTRHPTFRQPRPASFSPDCIVGMV